MPSYLRSFKLQYYPDFDCGKGHIMFNLKLKCICGLCHFIVLGFFG